MPGLVYAEAKTDQQIAALAQKTDLIMHGATERELKESDALIVKT